MSHSLRLKNGRRLSKVKAAKWNVQNKYELVLPAACVRGLMSASGQSLRIY
jgi:hypothetical protein